MDAQKFREAATMVKNAYHDDIDFRKATIDSILSAIIELKGSHTDEEVAVAVADRVFGDK